MYSFADYIGQPYDEEMLTQTSCGAGKMLALSPGGKNLSVYAVL